MYHLQTIQQVDPLAWLS